MEDTPVHYCQVTAALIPVDGRLFIAQRPPHKRFGLMWEFPGGKVECGEGLQDSLVREIREELCWDIRVGGLFQRVRALLPGMAIDLHAFWCTIKGGSLCLREHVSYCWAPVEELHCFGFTRADDQLVSLLEGLKDLPGDTSAATPPVLSLRAT